MNEAAAKETVYKEYHEKVMCYIRGKVYNRQDAEDLANDVFVKVFEKLDSYDSKKASISTWIYTITKNTVIDYYRKRKEFCELDESFAAAGEIEADQLNEEMLATLADALGSLDERLRTIIILHYFSGLTLKAIAEKMELSYSYIKLLHNSGLTELRSRLEQ